MKIWYSKYQLYSKTALNSRVKQISRNGALLRVKDEEGRIGYSDVCPFSEMGDHPLDLELKKISTMKPTALGGKSLIFACSDAIVRSLKQSSYEVSIKLKNHFLICDVMQFDLNRTEKLKAEGYTEFKIKIGSDLERETIQVEKLLNRLSLKNKIRLDFNGKLSRDQFVVWFEKNQNWLRSSLEFIEDPFSYDAKSWSTLSDSMGVHFALDLEARTTDVENPEATLGAILEEGAIGAKVIVVKPAIQNEDRIFELFNNSSKKFVFTHYMDFPVGQMCAHLAAQKFMKKLTLNNCSDQMLSCGLQYHDSYDGVVAQSFIQNDGPYIIPPTGYGFGFDKFLENQTWTSLK